MSGRQFDVSNEIAGLDTERILRTLAGYRVDYVLVGGLATIAHGSTLATADADIVPDPDSENLDRLLDALVALDAKVLVSEQRLAMEADEPWEVEALRRGAEGLTSAQAWHFTTVAGPVDVVMEATGVGPYEAHLGAAEDREVFGVVITVAGLADLIASKKALGRPKDEAILRELLDLGESPSDEDR